MPGPLIAPQVRVLGSLNICALGVLPRGAGGSEAPQPLGHSHLPFASSRTNGSNQLRGAGDRTVGHNAPLEVLPNGTTARLVTISLFQSRTSARSLHREL